MKTKHWLVSVLVLSTTLIAHSVLADEQLDSPGKPAKAKRAETGVKPEAAKPTAESAAPVTAPEPAVVKAKAVNVRGQAAINSEVVTRLKQGDPVTVLEEVTLKKPKVDEPAQWYKIALPANSFVWVHTSFVDAATKAVIPKRLNLRSGPGENYSIVGRIDKGTVVKEVETKGDWMKIEAPPQAYGFVAAHLLERQPATAPPTVVATEPPKPPAPPPAPVETTVVTTPPPPPPAAPPTEPPPPLPPAVTPPPTVTPVVTAPPTPPSEPPVPPAPMEEVKRTVTREGLVNRSVSIQAPTYFVLSSLDNKRTINYLYSPSSNIFLLDFKGHRVRVSGEEGLDDRWPKTPVLTVETLKSVP